MLNHSNKYTANSSKTDLELQCWARSKKKENKQTRLTNKSCWNISESQRLEYNTRIGHVRVRKGDREGARETPGTDTLGEGRGDTRHADTRHPPPPPTARSRGPTDRPSRDPDRRQPTAPRKEQKSERAGKPSPSGPARPTGGQHHSLPAPPRPLPHPHPQPLTARSLANTH